MNSQRGYILPWALMTVMLGLFIAIPVAELVGNALRSAAVVEDQSREYYAADAAIQAVAADLKRGADAVPNPPGAYAPPQVDFGGALPAVSVDVVEEQTLSTVKPINYGVSGSPTVITGTNPQGTGLDLASDDDSYYKLTGDGSPPIASYVVTSEVIGFESVAFGSLRVTAASTKSSTKVEVFIYDPDDPLHTQNGYNPVPDATEILEVANTEQTFSVDLEDADVAYLNSLPTAQLTVKVRATRTGGFRLDTERIVFTMAGSVTSVQRDPIAAPTISTGGQTGGDLSAFQFDDTEYFTIASASLNGTQTVQYELTSAAFPLGTLDTLTVPFIAQGNKDNLVVEMFVYNPADPAHTDGGYDPAPDVTTTIPVHNLDRSVTLTFSAADLAYLNTLGTKTTRVRIRVTGGTSFSLNSDYLKFIATTSGAGSVVIKQVTQQYIDPGLQNPYLLNLAPHEGYALRLYNVRSGIMKVNWAAHRTDFGNLDTTIQVFRGFVVDSGVVVPPGRITTKPPAKDNDLISSIGSSKGGSYARTDLIDVEEGLYTIVFFNNSAAPTVTEPFAATGEETDTWVYAAAYKDYLVDSVVGNVEITAVLRQVPGPSEPPAGAWSRTGISWIENDVTIQSWQPQGLPEPRRDDDEDGIENRLDGQFAGSFTDEGLHYSNSFTDQNLGGTSYGQIVDRGGMTVRIVDALKASEGVTVSAIGDSGTATVSACGSNIYISAGSAVAVTCGSITLRSLFGSSEIQLSPDLRAKVPPSSRVRAFKTPSGEFAVTSLSANVQPVTVTLSTCKGGEVILPAGSRANLRKDPSGVCSVANDSSSQEPVTLIVGGSPAVLGPGDAGAVVEAGPAPSPAPTVALTPTATAVATPFPTAMPTPALAPSPTPSPTAIPPTVTPGAAPPPVPTAIAGQAVLTPLADVYVDQDMPAGNFGTGQTLSVQSRQNGSFGRNRRVLLSFDLGVIPSPAAVESAVLRLRVGVAPSSDRTYQAAPILSPWSESGPDGATWENQPPTGPPGGSATVTGSGGAWVEWEVTGDVAAILGGGAPNQGWLIYDTDEHATGAGILTSFDSRESAVDSYRPQLVIVFQVLAATPMPTAVATSAQ